ncbi:S8 family serine peptidase [Actinacidiphila acidipaludis]|uniref:S8 family serine peptidase n=1 Tax=Actinacidiphila acidipaludis TaxID=2873382 RepID=A0ABS7QGG3_9ACTN|nr:S8 family serine peptidase [Streptomyces acidipaludis]MBY8882264.1 S8 family serine peptidase [Streptomyces acidipaludis]
MAFAVAAVTAGALLTALPPAAAAAGGGAERRVIVELSGTPAADGARLDASDSAGTARISARRQTLAAAQDTFLADARGAGVHPGSVRRFGLLSDSVAMTVHEGDLAALGRLPGVAAVVPDAPMHTLTDVSVPLIGAPEVWKRKGPDGSPVRGKGVTVALLDSGVDYRHPDLGGCLGPGCKVVAGHDFVNNDDDPMDDNGHGTHVAGIVAAKAAEPGGITGVAPDATLTAYKVMDDSGSGYTSDIIAGLEAATDPANPHRADVVNMSLGGPGDGTDPLGLAATAAVKAGVVVVAAAGNDGPGPETVGTPAAADGVIAVGASTSGVRLASASYVSGTAGAKPELVQAQPWLMSANGPVKPVTAQVVDLGTADPVDWDAVGDVRGKALLVQHALGPGLDPWFAQLAQEAEKRGAVAVFGGAPSGAVGPQSVPAERGVVPAQPSSPHVSASGDDMRFDSVVLMSLDEFAYREMAARAANGQATVRISGSDVTDQMASFSSRGPVPGTFALKPDIVAPGVQIRSTMYSAWTPGVYRMSGTSMAAPHVAGAAALMRQLRPKDTPQQITSALVGSAKPLDGPGIATQGAGRLDVAAAADSVLTAAPATVSLGLADMARPTVGATRTVALSNPGRSRITATLSATGHATVTPRHVSVPAGGTARITVRVSAARPDADTDLDGRISVRPDHGSPLTVPYLLAVRPLTVRVSPDPSDGHATAYVYSPTPLAAAPVLTVTPPRGRPITVTATLDHATWYTAPLTGSTPGAYKVAANAAAATGQRLVGADAFEVTPPAAPGSAWQPVGPNNEAGALTTAPSAPDQAVLTQYGDSALWVTGDKGASWNRLARLPVAQGNGSVVIDPRDAAHWWYAVDGGSPGRSYLLQTRDRGRTWQVLDTLSSDILSFTADEQAHTLVAVTGTDLVVSTDGGATWNTVPSGVAGTVRKAVMSGGVLYLETYDNGLWAVPGVADGTPGTPRQLLDSTLLSGLAVVGDTLAVWEIGNGVEVSHDHGATWSTTLTLPYSGGGGLIASGGDLYIGAGSDDTSWVSHDQGRTWQQHPLPSPRALITDYDRWADGSVTVSSEEDGVYRSAADGSGAHRIGVQGQTVFDLAVSGGNLLAGTWSGTYRTALPVASPEWGRSGNEGCFGCQVPLLATAGHDVVWRVVKLAIGQFNVQRSADAGATWTTMGSYSEVPDALLVNPADPDRVTVAYHVEDQSGLYTTADGGKTWKVLHQDRVYSALTGDPVRPDRLWLGAADGLYRSDDGGATVAKVADGPVTAITLDGPRLIVGGDGIRVSSDGGRTFTAGNLGGLPASVSDVLRVGGALYAATAETYPNGLLKGGRGVLRSSDDGRTWSSVSAGLQDLDATRLAAAPDGSALYVGTVDGGVHRLPLRR